MPSFDEQIVELHYITVVDSLAEGKRNLLILDFLLDFLIFVNNGNLLDFLDFKQHYRQIVTCDTHAVKVLVGWVKQGLPKKWKNVF